MNTITITAKNVEILDDVSINELAAEASISLNRHVTWLKLVLTDDLPNANRQKIPREEFANVIKTGIFMPVKMSPGKINDGHDGAFPLGAMAHLKTDGNTIVSLAALWNTEREADVDYLKQRHKEGKPIEFSWELTYTHAEEEEGVQVLRGISMNAATVVGMPAYSGRTPALSISSAQDNGDKDMDTIEMKEHQRLMDEAKVAYEAQIKDLGDKVSALEASIKELSDAKASSDTELESLRSFKKEIEDAKAKLEKLNSIKTKFEEAGIKTDEKYFDEKAELLLGMSEAQLEFFIQELVSVASKNEKPGEAAIKLTSKNVPEINVGDNDEVSNKTLVEYLRSLDKR